LEHAQTAQLGIAVLPSIHQVSAELS
jgi:hypothetical protein